MDYKVGESPYKATFAKYLVRSLILKEIAKVPVAKLSEDHVDRSSAVNSAYPKPSAKPLNVDPKELKVGIIGAGIAGLYTAYILEFLDIPYEILEVSDRIGGRIYTHYFSEPNEEKPKHMYYDIGAMRFPDTPIMWR